MKQSFENLRQDIIRKKLSHTIQGHRTDIIVISKNIENLLMRKDISYFFQTDPEEFERQVEEYIHCEQREKEINFAVEDDPNEEMTTYFAER